MQLTIDQLENYFKFLYPDKSTQEILKVTKEWSETIEKGQKDLSQYFYHNENGKIVAALFFEHFIASSFDLKCPTRVLNDSTIKSKNLAALFPEILEVLKKKGARTIQFRLTEKPHLLPLLETLKEYSFKYCHSRIEFKTQVSDLPRETPNAFIWKPVTESGTIQLSLAAQILEKAGEGDPDWNKEDNNFELLQSYLKDSEFQSTLDCIHIGFTQDNPAAIVIAQVEPRSKWSRITYMGLLPEFRGQGLGLHVHRHGFEMIRAQNGKEYQGGTLSNNKPMLALFKKNQCQEFRRMQEWIWK